MRGSAGFVLRRRRGVGTLELILTLPVIVVMLVALVEYTTLMILQSTVTHAATVGAREAGKIADIEEVVEAVQAVLGANCITLSDEPGSGTKVILEDVANLTTQFGDPNLDCQLPTNPLASDEVRVTVCIEMHATPVCDALRAFGFSLVGKRFQVSSLVKKESPEAIIPPPGASVRNQSDGLSSTVVNNGPPVHPYRPASTDTS